MIALCLLLFIAVSSFGADRKPAVRTPYPQSPYWFALETPSWNQAVAKLVEVNGDKDYIAIPLASDHWLIVWKAMLAGDVVHVGYGVKSFSSASEAAVFYDSMSSRPVRRILDWHDGTILVVYKCSGDSFCD